ncbi:MAG TPA: SGNH/GDSL hydrolase family protein [Epulopiscium sp.]|nr:SGNH/GDSL hydrolase family protein [Candidatus Epulonipiscium sp.]
MLIKTGSKLVMIGDSITDCGRQRPIGEGYKGELGEGYVSLVHALIDATYPEREIRTINMGISGNTSDDLKARWKTDLMALKPDWVSILIGINDIWRKVDHPAQYELHIPVEDYKANVDYMVADAKAAGINVVLMTPFMMENNENDFMRQQAEVYGQICKEIAQKHEVIFVDLQAEFNNFLAFNYSAVLSGDRVHPNRVGHMIIAKAFLNAVQIKW